MPADPVDVTVGGRTYRLVSSTDPETLTRLAEIVDQKLREMDSRHPQALLLAAIALANDVERLSRDNEQLAARSRQMLRSLLVRVDDALDHMDENGEPLSRPPA